MQKKKKITAEKYEKEKSEEKIVEYVRNSFLERREKRSFLEKQWQLNIDFLAGRQYNYISGKGEILNLMKEYCWQERGVYNHIAPITESRLAKFSRIDPIFSVKPNSDDDKEIYNAFMAEQVLIETFKKINIKKIISAGTAWAEVCGTAFYKTVWDNEAGRKVGEADGKNVYEGDVKVIPVSPFEIFPDSLTNENIEDCKSIIHAKVLSVSEIKDLYGVSLDGEEIDVFTLESSFEGKSVKNQNKKQKNSLIVIEYYEKPTKEFKEGRLITVAKDKLLYYGSLPYKNGNYESYTFPFVKQCCIKVAGTFFGQSVIERLIPVQRAYNAVKNRKQEFLNRLTLGVMTAEDGSIDAEDLSLEGLTPGKVIVYRQGSNPPQILKESSVPESFKDEEQKLLNEFIMISGVSDVSASSVNATVSSGTALELLIEQDNERLTVIAEEIRNCYLCIAKQILRLFRQFLACLKICSTVDNESKTKFYYVDKSVITSDDISIDNENELLYTENQKKEVIFKLYSSGILEDNNGQVKQEIKEKVLTLLGYKNLSGENGLIKLQQQKAQEENKTIKNKKISTSIIDDDSIHIEEHTRYALSEFENLSENDMQNIYSHILEHKKRLMNN